MRTIERLFDFLLDQAENYPQEHCVGAKNEMGATYLSTKQVHEKVNRLSAGLLNKGVQKGDTVAMVVAKNRPEWLIADLAVQQIGAILVPVYPTISLQDYKYIFSEASIKYCFTDGGELLDKMEWVKQDVPTLEAIFSFDASPKAIYWETLLSEYNMTDIEAYRTAVKKDDLATIIYTSGTTGNPKGVMLSHWNITSNVLAAKDLIPNAKGDRILSFLPLCHIFEKVVTYAYLGTGMSITYTGLDNLGGEGGDLRFIKPHFFTAVPRLLEKVYEKIVQKGMDLTGVKKKLFFWALSLTENYEYDQKPTGLKAIQWKIADKLIFSKWREALGGNVKGILTGAAACPSYILKAFSAAGIPIREGYGLTEASPGISFNRYDKGNAMVGTVGLAVEGVEIRIDGSGGDYRQGEGEILAAGPNIMIGYYKQPELTAEVLKEMDGKTWLLTGDIGVFVKGPGGKNFLKITDRKKELLKTSGGKYIAPAPIESALKQDFLIDQVMVIGEQKKFVSALIVPAIDSLRKWCQENGVLWTNIEDTLRHPKVIEYYQTVVDKYNKGFAKFEQIKRFTLIDSPWEIVKPDGSPGELTPTLKLKRRVIVERWGDIINDMYTES
jgi:long-chain acyl-CoA synthetase